MSNLDELSRKIRQAERDLANLTEVVKEIVSNLQFMTTEVVTKAKDRDIVSEWEVT